VTSIANTWASIQTVLDGGKEAYIWPNMQTRIQVSSRSSIRATIQPVLVGGKYAYISHN
jgi:hypothetical protein